MKAQEIDILSGKSDQQLLECVNLAAIAFNGETLLVHILVEVAWASSLHPVAIALVLGNIRTNAPVP
jgi:predicted transcriptional regulator